MNVAKGGKQKARDTQKKRLDAERGTGKVNVLILEDDSLSVRMGY